MRYFRRNRSGGVSVGDYTLADGPMGKLLIRIGEPTSSSQTHPAAGKSASAGSSP